MPIAAVPKYLGSDFKTASPGMRFGMYLQLWGINNRTHEPIWTTHDINYRVTGRNNEEREYRDENKTFCLQNASVLTDNDKTALVALERRQEALAKTCGETSLFIMAAQSIAPFTTGLGNEHPLENGFAFLNPYGLPYLPGSGVKGVLRQAARELANGQWDNPQGWSKESIEVLFGSDPEQELKRGVLSFWDVIPQIKGDHLAVDIMTPHQSHYYQNNPAAGSANPHESGQPNPICFLTVPPKSGFTFYVQCDLARLKKFAPNLLEKEGGAQNELWRILLGRAFEHAFQWLGFGAKTAVGYGAMESDAQRERREKVEHEQHQAENEKRQLQNAKIWQNARIKFDHRNGALTVVEKGGQSATALAPKGEELFRTLPAGVQQQIRSGVFVRITAQVSEKTVINIKV